MNKNKYNKKLSASTAARRRSRGGRESQEAWLARQSGPVRRVRKWWLRAFQEVSERNGQNGREKHGEDDGGEELGRK